MQDSSQRIAGNLGRAQQLVLDALAKNQRSPEAAELLVVSKTWPAQSVVDVAEAGHFSFGENKVQEAESKIVEVLTLLPHKKREDFTWHLIGKLQRNKARKAVHLFDVIHGVDSLKLARAISNVSVELGEKQKVYLQVNIGDEEAKSGFSPESVKCELEKLVQLPGLEILGLMCIPPNEDTAELSRPWFFKLKCLRDELQIQYDIELPGLSMGMSRDFEVAIEEGSTIVRVGSAIFGARNYT